MVSARFIRIAAASLAMFAPVAANAACVKPGNVSALATAVVAGINAQRQAQGLDALQSDSALTSAAQGLACDNAARQGISHVSLNGARLPQRLRAASYRFATAAENTGRGFGSAERAVAFWMESSGHRENILNNSIRDIGIGIAMSDAPDSRLHWVVNFGARR